MPEGTDSLMLKFVYHLEKKNKTRLSHGSQIITISMKSVQLFGIRIKLYDQIPITVAS